MSSTDKLNDFLRQIGDVAATVSGAGAAFYHLSSHIQGHDPRSGGVHAYVHGERHSVATLCTSGGLAPDIATRHPTTPEHMRTRRWSSNDELLNGGCAGRAHSTHHSDHRAASGLQDYGGRFASQSSQSNNHHRQQYGLQIAEHYHDEDSPHASQREHDSCRTDL